MWILGKLLLVLFNVYLINSEKPGHHKYKTTSEGIQHTIHPATVIYLTLIKVAESANDEELNDNKTIQVLQV